MMKSLVTLGLFTLMGVASSNTFAYCVNEEFLMTPAPEIGGTPHSTIVNANAGKISSIQMDGKTFRITRSAGGTITGFIDEAGHTTSIAEIDEAAPLRKGGIISKALEPCQMGGDSLMLEVAGLPQVEITRESAGDTYMWRDIAETVYPSVPEVVGLGPDPHRVKACKPGYDSCMKQAAENLPMFFAACLKTSDFAKAKRPSWGALIYTAIIAACGAAAEWMKNRNENECANSFASCSAGG